MRNGRWPGWKGGEELDGDAGESPAASATAAKARSQRVVIRGLGMETR